MRIWTPEEILDAKAVKDPEHHHPVPAAWRSSLRRLAGIVAGPEARDDADHIGAENLARWRENVADYGCRLGSLPDEAWRTSIAQWNERDWDVLVDLFDAEGNPTDLVMFVKATEAASGYTFKVMSVHVP